MGDEILDASIEIFQGDVKRCQTVLRVFLSLAANDISRLSLDAEPDREILSPEVAEIYSRVFSHLSRPRRKLFAVSELSLNKANSEDCELFVQWAYWSAEANVIGENDTFLFELVDGGSPAEYLVNDRLKEAFIGTLEEVGVWFPSAWKQPPIY